MSFNEWNSVEHYIIHQLTGINLNSLSEKTPTYLYQHQPRVHLLFQQVNHTNRLYDIPRLTSSSIHM